MDHIIHEGKKLFAAKDVAHSFHIDNSAMNAWLRIHDSFRENESYIIELGGGKKPRRFFTELGVTAYGNLKDKTFKGNQHPKREGPSLYSLQTQIVEKAFTKNHEVVPFSQDPIIAMRVKQIEHESRIEAIESLMEMQRIEQTAAEQKLLSFPESSKEAPKRTVRSLVVEYVSAFAQNSKLPHNIVWGKIYKEYSIRTKINLRIRAKASKLSVLEYVEQNGDIEILYAIAKEILV